MSGSDWGADPGDCAYGDQGLLHAVQSTPSAKVVAEWYYGNSLRSLRVQAGKGAAVVKHWSGLAWHRGPELAGLVAECADRGYPHPSSYAGCFAALYRTPRIPWTAHAAFSPYLRGNWEQWTPGTYTGHWREYDLRSAYRSAAATGLPDPATWRFHEGGVAPRGPGLYVVDLASPRLDLPPPFNRERRVLLATEDRGRFGLEGAQVRYGVSWTRDVPVRPMERAIESWSFGKLVSRMFWGRWVGGGRLLVRYPGTGTVRQDPPRDYCSVWAALVMGRVRAKVWMARQRLRADGARFVRTYADSVVTDGTLPVGESLGQWRLVREGAGVIVPTTNAKPRFVA